MPGAADDAPYVVPELMRGLRRVGAVQGALAEPHATWWAPLLELRRRVAGPGDPLRLAALADASALRVALDGAIGDIARAEAGGDAALERATAAWLRDDLGATFVAIDQLARAAQALREGPVEARRALWARWVEALAAVFVAADAGWERLEAAAPR